MTDNNAYLDYVQPETTGGELNKLQQLIDQQAKAEAVVADLEAQLSKARESVKDLAERQVPELMDQIGITEFKTTTGLNVGIDETIRASIPKAKAPLAFAWLKQHDHAAMIKRTVSLSFGKGEDDKANNFCESLDSQSLEYDDKAAVHPATLSAFVREKLENGEEIPLDLFGVFRQRVAKIKTKK